nr:uncharacterized protein LOC113809786 [Penaeus vannamei]
MLIRGVRVKRDRRRQTTWPRNSTISTSSSGALGTSRCWRRRRCLEELTPEMERLKEVMGFTSFFSPKGKRLLVCPGKVLRCADLWDVFGGLKGLFGSFIPWFAFGSSSSIYRV